jgi:hypothetical protein
MRAPGSRSAPAGDGHVDLSELKHLRKRQRVIAANPELREREVLKAATLHDLLQALLAKRAVPEQQGAYLVRLAPTVWEQAFSQWIEPGTGKTFESCMADAATELEGALSLCRPPVPG